MSKQWSGGKGDKNRTSNYRMYTSNYDNIFCTKAKAVIDLWGNKDRVDIFEDDIITYNKEGDNFRLVVISESPGKVGEASGNAGKPFYISKELFNEKYKPWLKEL